MSVTSTRRNLTRKALDPVFICMVGAMLLAIASSMGLRAMVAGAGPAAANASEFNDQPTHLSAPHHPATKPN